MNEGWNGTEGQDESPSIFVVIFWAIGIFAVPALIGWATSEILDRIPAASQNARLFGILVGMVCFVAALKISDVILKKNNYFEHPIQDLDSDPDPDN